MSHELDMSNGRANMAYVGETPWHGLGFEIDPDSSIEQWQTVAGMDWEVKKSPVQYRVGSSWKKMPERSVLYRSDTEEGLGVMSSRYIPVQPKEILEFYRTLVDGSGFKLETAGCLFGGRKYWALAKTGDESRIMGQDAMKGYLMLGSSVDGSMSTIAKFTSVRVVCNNTLQMAVYDAANQKATDCIRIPHNTSFDANRVKAQLGLAHDSWQVFMEDVNKMAQVTLSNKEALQYFINVLGNPSKPVEEQASLKTIKTVFQLYEGGGKGSGYRSAKGTLWGAINAVTEFTDHHAAAKVQDNRLNSAWFGDNSVKKDRAWDEARLLIAA